MHISWRDQCQNLVNAQIETILTWSLRKTLLRNHIETNSSKGSLMDKSSTFERSITNENQVNMALPFSIENILARPTYRPIKPTGCNCAARNQPYPQPYPFFMSPTQQCAVTPEMRAPFSTTARKRRKRYRTIFTETQIAVLEDLYKKTPYPDLYQRESVAFHAGLQEERVEVWFKNRRARTRKLKRTPEKELPESKRNEESEKAEKKEGDLEKTEEKNS